MFTLHAGFAVLLWLTGQLVVGNECCSTVQWTNPEWCHASNCKGIGCQFDNPATVVDESKTKCQDITKCFCAKIAGWQTKNFCNVLRSCEEAQKDYEVARKKILGKQTAAPSPECIGALTRTICAYHFPYCINDIAEYSQICHSTCADLNQTCGVTLADFAQVGMRCNLKLVDSTNAGEVSRANQRCTSKGAKTRLQGRALGHELVCLLLLTVLTLALCIWR